MCVSVLYENILSDAAIKDKAKKIIKMTAMKYSIITPVYNREDCIARCLESVVRNLKPGIEIEHIVVDDGSHDKTAEVVREYAKNINTFCLFNFRKIEGPMRREMLP